MITSKYFNMGKVVVTHGINETMTENSRFTAEVNLSFSGMRSKIGEIWIITNRISENDGDNATTVCFPSER